MSAMIRELLRDCREAARMLRAPRSVGWVIVLVHSITFGVGCAILALVDCVVFRGVPFADGGRLVSVSEISPRTQRRESVAPQNYFGWRTLPGVFNGLAARSWGQGFRVVNGRQPDPIRVDRVTASFFEVLSAHPQAGHLFGPEAETGPQVAIISDRIWRHYFNAASDLRGQYIESEQGRWDVVGVTPSEFRYPLAGPLPADAWVPYVPRPSDLERTGRRSSTLEVIGRLHPTMSLPEARRRLVSANAAIVASFPVWSGGRQIDVRSLRDAIVGDTVTRWMTILLVAVGVVVSIAHVNVIVLQLARAAAQAKVVALKACLGASPRRLARQPVLEALILASLGAACGMAIAASSIGIVRAALPANVPRLATVSVDLRVLWMTSAAALIGGCLTGVLPALQTYRSARHSGRQAMANSSRRGAVNARFLLASLEVALGVVMLVGGTLFISSFVQATRTDLGMNYRDVWTVPVYPIVDSVKMSDPALTALEVRRAQLTVLDHLEQARALPGVSAVAVLGAGLPFSRFAGSKALAVDGVASDVSVEVRQASSGYKEVVRLTMMSGRWILDGDVADASPVVVLNDVAERAYFQGAPSLGRHVEIGGVRREVVGVVRGVRNAGPETTLVPEAYVPFAQSKAVGADLVLRVAAGSGMTSRSLADRLGSDASDPRSAPVSLAAMFEPFVAERRFNMVIAWLFVILSAGIAAAAVYGVVRHHVVQRFREMGVRLALGASPAMVGGMVLAWAGKAIVVGLVVGVPVAFVLARQLESFLFRVTAWDSAVYGLSIGVLVIIGMAAALRPALSAARVDPVAVMRVD
jgi:predicted permease